MQTKTKDALYEAWDYCDKEDKSTEFMFQYMADTTNVNYDRVVDFVMENTPEKRQAWYDKQDTLTKEDQYILFLEDRIKLASSPQTKSSYIICLENFKKLWKK